MPMPIDHDSSSSHSTVLRSRRSVSIISKCRRKQLPPRPAAVVLHSTWPRSGSKARRPRKTSTCCTSDGTTTRRPIDAGKEYNALKDKAHKGVNTACQHVLAGKIAEAKGAFAHAWQCRSACDWMFPPLMSWEPNPKDPDGSKHAFNAKCFEEMGQSLCTGKDGTPRADVDPALFEKFSKEYEKKKD